MKTLTRSQIAKVSKSIYTDQLLNDPYAIAQIGKHERFYSVGKWEDGATLVKIADKCEFVKDGKSYFVDSFIVTNMIFGR